MEALISLQSAGQRSIGEPTAPRPIGVEQGAVLVVLDVNKGASPAALYWALAHVVRKGDAVKVLGIITHIASAMGFMVRVEQSSRTSPNVMELQFEIATRKEAIWRIAHVKEWCRRAGVKLSVDVKAGNNPRVIAVDEAKAMGAYHVILDKNMKKDGKYFVDNLGCFVTRCRSGGGVEVVRAFAMPMLSGSKLPPMAPAAVKARASVGSSGSRRGASSMSSTSFELGGESSDDYSAQEGDPVSAPSKPTVRKWLSEEVDPPLTPRGAGFESPRVRHMGTGSGRVGQLNVERQASFSGGWRRHGRQEKVSMDVQWPLMHWAEARRGVRLRRMQYGSAGSMHNFRVAVAAGRRLNYSDMVASD